MIDLEIIGIPGFLLDPDTTEIVGRSGKVLNQRVVKIQSVSIKDKYMYIR